ncbi:MAG TPA: carbohydrate binding family 9 domain-containing protein, partial [Candidatus Polarisedimenticolia bacterium]|nr:carbohydrate binding family 9 domain-containing protein [Candidatus Polarisedimenticolia bacterium]
MPSLQAYHLGDDEHIKLDGHLDDGAWDKAEAGSGFKKWEPDRGAMPTEETVFKVAYDESAIYFGVACLEKDPSKVTARLSRRDRFSNSDIVSVYIDPYLDHTTGYNFRVNPLGVLQDSYMYNDGDRDDNWDAVWQAQTYQDKDGWYAELKIPFSAIRYRAADSMTWGLDVWRYMHGRGEDTAWVTWD